MEVEFWFEHVREYEDLELVDQVMSCYYEEAVDKIIERFYNGEGMRLSTEDREYLENFYVLNMVEDILEED